VLGVSTRGYEQSLHPMPETVSVGGASKSAASRHIVTETTQRIHAGSERDPQPRRTPHSYRRFSDVGIGQHAEDRFVRATTAATLLRSVPSASNSGGTVSVTWSMVQGRRRPHPSLPRPLERRDDLAWTRSALADAWAIIVHSGDARAPCS
jgi:hypothetical protein